MSNPIASTCAHDHTEYPKFQEALTERVFSLNLNQPLFTTDAKGMWEAYLHNLPAEHRQHYNCHACRKFIETYGGLAEVHQDGTLIPAIWPLTNHLPFFHRASLALYQKVRKARVTGVFYSNSDTWGQPVTGEWCHLHVLPRKEHLLQSKVLTPGQAMAAKREDFKNVQKALSGYPLAALQEAVKLLKGDNLPRSAQVLGPALWLRDLKKRCEEGRNPQIRNIVWASVAVAPEGFCHPRSSMLGTLLDDIASGVPFAELKRRFSEKMAPLQYQRPQAPPSAGTVEQAEKLVQKLGIEKSLDRRYARYEEVPKIWQPTQEDKAEAPIGGVFSQVRTKEDTQVTPVNAPPEKITWVKFRETVLPEAEGIEFYVTPNPTTFAAVMTAADPTAPPILQWDLEDERNPFSWYLHALGSIPAAWGLPARGWHPVPGICLQPSMWTKWGKADNAHHGKGVFFLLEGAADVDAKKVGNGLFPSMLKSELHGVRAVIESYSNATRPQGSEQASACGIFLHGDGPWTHVFKVRSNGTEQTYVIDRWD